MLYRGLLSLHTGDDPVLRSTSTLSPHTGDDLVLPGTARALQVVPRPIRQQTSLVKVHGAGRSRRGTPTHHSHHSHPHRHSNHSHRSHHSHPHHHSHHSHRSHHSHHSHRCNLAVMERLSRPSPPDPTTWPHHQDTRPHHYHTQAASLEVDVLIAESNAGSVVWPKGAEKLPFDVGTNGRKRQV